MFLRTKSAYDFLIVGLGNPGREYENTRHNIGFMAADALREKFGATLERSKNKALICECKIGDKRVLIAKPQTFMNLSGAAVSEICKFYKIPYDKVIIMFDDVSLDVGKIRMRRSGSHGGHNGMKDISLALSTNDIFRIKIGVGQKPHPEYDLKDWVLGKFPKSDADNISIALNKVIGAVSEVLNGKIETAMNKYNS